MLLRTQGPTSIGAALWQTCDGRSSGREATKCEFNAAVWGQWPGYEDIATRRHPIPAQVAEAKLTRNPVACASHLPPRRVGRTTFLSEVGHSCGLDRLH